jgi:hypothetical protein
VAAPSCVYPSALQLDKQPVAMMAAAPIIADQGWSWRRQEYDIVVLHLVCAFLVPATPSRRYHPQIDQLGSACSRHCGVAIV